MAVTAEDFRPWNPAEGWVEDPVRVFCEMAGGADAVMEAGAAGGADATSRFTVTSGCARRGE